jgi:hypothetical protein
MDGGFTRVPISEEVTLHVQGHVQGVIVGVEIPQPKVIGELCAELAKAEEVMTAAHAMAGMLDEYAEEDSRYSDKIEATVNKFRMAHNKYMEVLKKNHECGQGGKEDGP